MTRTAMILSLVATLAGPAMATTYYLDITVGSSGDGSVGSPWKTLADASTGLDALGDDGAGDTLMVSAGSYGQLTGGVWEKARTDWLTVKADTGETVRIGNGVSHKGVDLSPASLTDIMLVLDGLFIQNDNTNPLPNDDGYYHNTTSGSETTACWLENCENLTIQNCDISGSPYRWLTKNAVFLTGSSSVTISGCTIHGTSYYGIEFLYSTDVSIVGNIIYDIAQGGCISQRDHCFGDILIDRNHVMDCYSPYINTSQFTYYEHYAPYNETNSTVYHSSTNLGLHAYQYDDQGTYDANEASWDSMVIRRNVIHDAVKTGPSSLGGGSQCVLSYGGGWGYYNAMTIESNLWLDGGLVYFYNLGATESRPVIFRNNTWIGGRSSSTDVKTPGQIGTWYNSIGALTLYEGNEDWEHVYMYNDLWRGRVSGYTYFPDNDDTTFVNKNCIFYAPQQINVIPSWKDATTLFAVWSDGSFALRGNPNFFRYAEDYGPWTRLSWTIADDWTGPSGDKDYDYSDNGVQIVFTDAYARDFTLTGNVPYLDGNVDFDTYGDASVQSPYSLGQFDADGFILDNGQARDADHHSVGAYEAGATIGYPVRPAVCMPFHLEYNVDTSRQLVWRSGIGAESYNVYLSTNRSLVEARNASCKIGSEITDATCDPTLNGETTYYWTADSVGSSDLVAPGIVMEFTTSDSEDEDGEPEPPAETKYLMIRSN